MESIQEIKERFKNTPIQELPAFCEIYRADERKGVQKLVEQGHKRIAALEKEKERLKQMREFEREYEHLGYICGIDEVGRGPFAGPVVAGAVILPPDCEILYVNDSKQLSEKMREQLYDEIMEKAVSVAVTPQILLNEAVTIPQITIPQVPIIKGDAKSISIAAASIVAKVTRDRLMREYDKIMPEYGFASNKGYGSKEHIEAIKKYGPTPIHRRSFIHNVTGENYE